MAAWVALVAACAPVREVFPPAPAPAPRAAGIPSESEPGPRIDPAPPPAPDPGDAVVTAALAAGKEGYVRSPYTRKLILVRGIPPGVVLQDQTTPAAEKKFFRVP